MEVHKYLHHVVLSSEYINDRSLTSNRFEWQQACLPGTGDMEFFLTGIKMQIVFISIFNTRRNIIKFKLPVKNTCTQ